MSQTKKFLLLPHFVAQFTPSSTKTFLAESVPFWNKGLWPKIVYVRNEGVTVNTNFFLRNCVKIGK